MAPPDFVEKHWRKMAIALLLTFASGLVDINGYLGIFHFFTAHLTGTTVHLGHDVVDKHWTDVLAAVSIVAAFLGGSILGRVLIELGSRSRFRKIASVALTIEAVLLLLAIQLRAILPSIPYEGLALLAGAMGMQTAILTGIGPLTVHTTFVTGMLNKIAQLVSHIVFRSHDHRKSRTPDSAEEKNQRRDIVMASFLAAIWCCYVAGAAFGTWTFSLWGLRALFVAIACLIVSVGVDGFWPLSIQEEIEQSER